MGSTRLDEKPETTLFFHTPVTGLCLPPVRPPNRLFLVLLGSELELVELKFEVAGLKFEVAGLRLEVAELKFEVAGLRLGLTNSRFEPDTLRFGRREAKVL